MDIQATIKVLDTEIRRLEGLTQARVDLLELAALAEREAALEKRIAEADEACTKKHNTADRKISAAHNDSGVIIEKAKKDADREIARTETECKRIQDELVQEKNILGAQLKKMRSEYANIHKKLEADTLELASLETKLTKARRAIASVH